RVVVNVLRVISPHEQWCKPGKPKQAKPTPVEMISVSRCICCGRSLRSRSWGCCRLGQSRNSGQRHRKHRRSNRYPHCVFILSSWRTPNELADGMFLANSSGIPYVNVTELCCPVNMCFAFDSASSATVISWTGESET